MRMRTTGRVALRAEIGQRRSGGSRNRCRQTAQGTRAGRFAARRVRRGGGIGVDSPIVQRRQLVVVVVGPVEMTARNRRRVRAGGGRDRTTPAAHAFCVLVVVFFWLLLSFGRGVLLVRDWRSLSTRGKHCGGSRRRRLGQVVAAATFLRHDFLHLHGRPLGLPMFLLVQSLVCGSDEATGPIPVLQQLFPLIRNRCMLVGLIVARDRPFRLATEDLFRGPRSTRI